MLQNEGTLPAQYKTGSDEQLKNGCYRYHSGKPKYSPYHVNNFITLDILAISTQH
jgi:hypothetical protein